MMIEFVEGPAGKIQMLTEFPDISPIGIVMISHPQPLLGGSPRHIVPHSLARRLTKEGWIAVRPSFRGVDGSDGLYSGGIGEAEDTVVIAKHLSKLYPGIPLAMVGFSFGAHVYARAACLLESELNVDALALLGLPVGIVPGGRHYDEIPVPAKSLLLHGQDDQMAPLSQLLKWGKTSHHPITVFPGTDHFFKGCLSVAIEHVLNYLRLCIM